MTVGHESEDIQEGSQWGLPIYCVALQVQAHFHEMPPTVPSQGGTQWGSDPEKGEIARRCGVAWEGHQTPFCPATWNRSSQHPVVKPQAWPATPFGSARWTWAGLGCGNLVDFVVPDLARWLSP